MLDLPQLQRIAEAFSKTRPRYMLFYAVPALLAYAAMYLIDKLGAPIPDTFVTIVGFAMMLLVGAGAVAVQGSLAADAALDLPLSLGNAFNNYTKAIPLALAGLLAAVLLLAGNAFGGGVGLLVTGLLTLWFAPLVIMFLADAAQPPHRAFFSAIAHTVRHAVDTVPPLLLAALLLWLSLYTVIGAITLLYIVPFISVLAALTYRDLHGIDHG